MTLEEDKRHEKMEVLRGSLFYDMTLVDYMAYSKIDLKLINTVIKQLFVCRVCHIHILALL